MIDSGKSLTRPEHAESRREFLRIHPHDNVLVALRDFKSGETVSAGESPLTLLSAVGAKHKVATSDILAGAQVTMYGIPVGRATQLIRTGEVLTTQNVHHYASAVDGKAKSQQWTAPDVSRWNQQTFQGYMRADGQVGTRNYWLVVPLVFCENRNVAVLKKAFEEELGYAAPQTYRKQVARLVETYRQGKLAELDHDVTPDATDSSGPPVFPNVDGIKFLVHEGGCGGTRQDARGLAGLLAGYIHHPNVAGATILSLGCQNAQIALLQEEIARRNPKSTKPLIIVEQQQTGSEFAMLSHAIRETFLGLAIANEYSRQPAFLSHLTVGLKCGGSDGFSGISANPAIGHTSDLIAALGGKTILSEFPELCGVEQELVDRATSSEIADRFLRLMREYNARAQAVGSGFDMNPSPGNIRDGLITDAMKSAGAARKGGTSPVVDVLDFPEYATRPGLNLLCTPGNDVESVTAEVGAGANVVLFTTGLGTPTGNPIAPVIKISTNSNLQQRMRDIIDFDAGPIISGTKTVEGTGEDILDLIVKAASGEIKTRAEQLGQDDFIPWKRGISL